MAEQKIVSELVAVYRKILVSPELAMRFVVDMLALDKGDMVDSIVPDM